MKLWEDFLKTLEKEVGVETIDKWLKPLQVIQYDAANLYLQAENSFQIAWFEEHIRPRLKGKFLNNNFRPVTVYLTLPGKPSSPSLPPTLPFSIASLSLDPDMTLETFIPAPQNEMAYRLIVEKSFNPLFIHGPKGSGKTHLLQAAAHQYQLTGIRYFLTSADQFTDHVVTAIRQQKMREFRKMYREIDALIVDNIETLKGRAATQEEFFHTFNTLHTEGKQIILSSTLSPSELQDIEPRLISRFEWGLSIPIQKIAPDLILKQKARTLWKNSDLLISWLLASFPRDPLTPFYALVVRAKGELVAPQAAALLLKDFLAQEKENALTPEKIIKAIASHHGLRSEDLLGKSQTKEIAAPRKLAMYLIREKLNLPYQKIGELFGRDHSTVMSSIEQIRNHPDPSISLLKF